MKLLIALLALSLMGCEKEKPNENELFYTNGKWDLRPKNPLSKCPIGEICVSNLKKDLRYGNKIEFKDEN